MSDRTLFNAYQLANISFICKYRIFLCYNILFMNYCTFIAGD